jgi:hypothetical protein
MGGLQNTLGRRIWNKPGANCSARRSSRHSIAERVPESERWREVGHSVGHRAPTVPAHDEQTDTEKLVEEGIGEAEHDQMVEATREGLRKDTGH